LTAAAHLSSFNELMINPSIIHSGKTSAAAAVNQFLGGPSGWRFSFGRNFGLGLGFGVNLLPL
jgi:hypothetical protein